MREQINGRLLLSDSEKKTLLNAALALVHYADARFGWWDDRETALRRDEEYTERGLAIDPANAYRLTGRHEDAIAAFKAYGERSPSAGLVDLVLCYQQTRRMTEAKAGARQALAANPKFTIGNWRKTQFRNDVAQLEADVAALEAAGLPE